MHLKSISLTHFNNYQEVSSKVHQRMNAFTGLNGMGKTNMLDAIYYLCLGKSYFSSIDRHVVKKGESFFRLFGEFQVLDGVENVEIKVSPGSKKEIIYSGKKRKKLSDHIGTLPCIIIAPLDIQLMLEGSEARRAFLDTAIMQYDATYTADILLYNRLLKQRNALLKSFAEKGYYDAALLESMSSGMYSPAARIYEARTKLLQRLSGLFEKYYNLLADEKESCKVEYISPLADKSLQEIFVENVEKDKILARTTKGIHKDDLRFLMNDYPLKNFASQGQLKSFVIALKLAQYEVVAESNGKNPILILDDIFDKLDRERVSRLLKILSGDRFGQTFISDTNLDRVPGLLQELNISHQAFEVADAQIKYV